MRVCERKIFVPEKIENPVQVRESSNLVEKKVLKFQISVKRLIAQKTAVNVEENQEPAGRTQRTKIPGECLPR